MNRHYLNSDDFDERGVLKDGHHLKVHMQAMDSGHRAMLDGKPARIMDGTGDPLGLHRPGYRVWDFNDAIANDAKAEARERYERELCDAWRGDAGNEGMVEGAACIVRNAEYPNDQGMPGHVRRIGGRLMCVPDAPKVSGNDAMPVDDIETAYRLYSEEISQAWRTPR